MASSNTFKLPGIWTNFTSFAIFAVFAMIIVMMSAKVQAQTLGGDCTNNNDCRTNEVCDDGKCACAPHTINETTSCRLPRYGESCANIQCEDSLECDDASKKCTCTSSQYHDSDAQQCEDKKGLGEKCNDPLKPCFYPLECKSQVCQCKDDDFSPDNFTCQSKKAFNASCSQSNECKANLSCIVGRCGCIQASQFYSLSTFDCQLRKDEGDECLSMPNECKSTLSCLIGNCACADTEYFDSLLCQPKKGYNSGCSDSKECLGSLTCQGSFCTCLSTQYNDGDTCKERKGKSFTCSDTKECLDTLTCVSLQCNCLETQYSEGNSCKAKKTFDNQCSKDYECQDTLSCLSTKCTCKSNEYIKGNGCEEKKTFGQTCADNSECQDTISCIGNKCDCDGSSQYNDGTKCFSRKSRTQSCTNIDKECKETLQCSGDQCICESNRYLDSGGQCQLKKNRDSSCTETIECQDGLSCLNNICNCISNIQYWDGSTCQTRKTRTQSCTNIDKECEETLQCSGGQCICESNRYLDSGGQCQLKKSNAAACTETKECLDVNAECRIPNSRSQTKCLCKSTYYQNQQTNECRLVNELKVSEPDPTPGVTFISFKWKTGVQPTGVFYRIKTSPNEGTKTATASGGEISGLNPGTKYGITIESYIPANDNYIEKFATISVTPDPWTFPSKPGQYDLSLSQLMTSPMTFGFTPSIGNVAKYKVTILKDSIAVITSKEVKINKVTDLTLFFAKTYQYKIIAVNGNGDESQETTGTFTTNAAASSKVQDFVVLEKTKSSVRLQWKPPTSPNGQIQFFVIQVVKEGDCIAFHYLFCTDCPGNPAVPSFPDCGPPTNAGGFTAKEVNDVSTMFNHNVSSLATYTEYTVKVFAVNVAGKGLSDEKTFTTDESAAMDLKELYVTSFRENSNKKVGLMVKWTPGNRTGQTNYTVTLMDNRNITNVRYVKLAGYEKINTTFSDLQAFHNYSVMVLAETMIGKSNPTTKDVITKTAIPGVISGLVVIPDRTYAKRMSLQFQCPDVMDRNGVIQGFIVKKSDSSGPKTDHVVDFFDCANAITVSSTQLGDFEIKKTYTFEVIARNQDFESSPSTPKTFYVAPKEPVFETDVLTEDPTVAVTTTTISLSLCHSCLTNSNQGEITHVGLIVCIKSKTNTCTTSRRKRAVMTVDEFQKYATWGQSKANNFNSKYRTTPNTWLATLKTVKPSAFVIGDNPTCSNDVVKNIYCNGPLPSGSEIVVTAVSCTEAGCQSQSTTGFVLKTKVPSSSSDDSTGMIAGIVVAVIVISVVIAVVVFLRIRKKKKEEPPHLPFKDLSDPQKKPIKIRDFKEQVALLHKDSNLMFQSEFEDIKSISADFKTTCEEAQRECNRVKNRYVDILPYDHSRVKLSFSSESEDGSDFINASYIPGLNSKREYIASQGPMHATIPHFWRMVWEQKSKVIVMLSDLMENNKMKVNLYWPENLNEPISYGDVVVEMTNFSQLNKYIIRNFKISVGNMDRRVTHFFIPGWWDFSANLTFDDVLEFAQLVRKETTPPDSGPLIVHCSAGVGRTGTFIALDYFMQYIERHSLDDDIDVFEYVLEMRKNRPRMVQAETQYIFIFDALVEVIERKIKIEQERLYDNMRPMEENVYANQMVTEHVYANSNFTTKDSTTVDFSYANSAFEPEDNYENGDYISSDKPTTVL